MLIVSLRFSMKRWKVRDKWLRKMFFLLLKFFSAFLSFSEITRSSFSQITSVPDSIWFTLSRYSWLTFFSKHQRFCSMMTSKSQQRADTMPSCFVTTVSRLHWENVAVFNPNPKRPRSFLLRFIEGPLVPSRIASMSVLSDIPMPSSRMKNLVLAPSKGLSMSIVLALAVILLSIKSAIAVSRV